jgi:hypothetical protein
MFCVATAFVCGKAMTPYTIVDPSAQNNRVKTNDITNRVLDEAENIKMQVIRESESHLGEPSAKVTRTSGPTSTTGKVVASVSHMLRRG